jgi:hypothetical protein
MQQVLTGLSASIKYEQRGSTWLVHTLPVLNTVFIEPAILLYVLYYHWEKSGACVTTDIKHLILWHGWCILLGKNMLHFDFFFVPFDLKCVV